MSQLDPFTPPAHGAQNWDGPLNDYLAEIQVAHNETDTHVPSFKWWGSFTIEDAPVAGVNGPQVGDLGILLPS